MMNSIGITKYIQWQYLEIYVFHLSKDELKLKQQYLYILPIDCLFVYLLTKYYEYTAFKNVHWHFF
jgi:hypothetical protein